MRPIVLIGMSIIIVGTLLLGAILSPDTEQNNLMVITDKTTGCEYVGRQYGSLRRHLDADRKHIGCHN